MKPLFNTISASVLSLVFANIIMVLPPSAILNLNEKALGTVADSPWEEEDTRVSKRKRVHILAIADAEFAKKYRPIFEKNERYARRHGYSWRVIGSADTESSVCTKMHSDYFFRKHCLVAEWMEDTLDEDDVLFVFDSDVVPYRSSVSLHNWTSIPEDVVFYERIWNEEIMAGNYMVRNNHRTRTFLKEWARYEYEKPGEDAFSSSDNGAIHLHIRRVVGLEERKTGHCGQLYRNLTAKSDNLDPYFEFVACARQNMTPGVMKALDGSGLTLRLLGKAKAWVVDGVYDPLQRDEFGPVFHHGLKPRDRGMPFYLDQIKKYDFNISELKPTIPRKEITDEVSCGGHFAPNCAMCVVNHDQDEWVGENWCNGDCIWIPGDVGPGSCVLW